MKLVKVILGSLIIFLGVASCNQQKEKSQNTGRPIKKPDSTAISSMGIDTTTGYNFNSENEFLGLGKPEFGDLDSMIARRRIRALVPYTHIYYSIDLKKRSGIAFEALELFETYA